MGSVPQVADTLANIRKKELINHHEYE